MRERTPSSSALTPQCSTTKSSTSFCTTSPAPRSCISRGDFSNTSTPHPSPRRTRPAHSPAIEPPTTIAWRGFDCFTARQVPYARTAAAKMPRLRP